MGFLSGKRILLTGLASKLSIAYGIAQAMHREGAELAFTYQNEKLKGRVEEFAAALGSNIVLPCDVAEDESIESLFTELAKVSTLSALRRQTSWTATTLTRSLVKVSKLLTISAPTALWRWRKPAAVC